MTAATERGRKERFPQRSLTSIAEAGFTPAEVLDDGKGGARTQK